MLLCKMAVIVWASTNLNQMEIKLTPKEKSIELLDKFIQTNGNFFFAKECAIFLVEEILDELNEFDIMDGYATSRIDYYNEVRNILLSSEPYR